MENREKLDSLFKGVLEAAFNPLVDNTLNIHNAWMGTAQLVASDDLTQRTPTECLDLGETHALQEPCATWIQGIAMEAQTV